MATATASLPTNGGRFQARVVLVCKECNTSPPRRFPCRPDLAFRWQENPEMELRKPVNEEPFVLVDENGQQHHIEFVTTAFPNLNCVRIWRAQFLADLMGPRDMPQRRLYQAVVDGAQAPAPLLQFRWGNNLHLMRDNLTYLMEAPNDPAWDMKVLKIFDTTGACHVLSYGTSTVMRQRLEKWRTQTINNTIKSFKKVFGAPLRGDSPQVQDQIFISSLQDYIARSGAGAASFTLDHHLEQLQAIVLPRIPMGGLRLELSGPNFPDFFRSRIARSVELQRLIFTLRWEGQVHLKSALAKRRFFHRILQDYSTSPSFQQGGNLATHIYCLWRLYGNGTMNETIWAFRRKLLSDRRALKLLAPFHRPENQQYRYGHVGQRVAHS